MCYDLYFWRQSKDFQKSPELVLDLLSEEEPVKGIITLRRDQVRRALREAFLDITGQDFDLKWQGAGTYFLVDFCHANETDVNLVIAECGDEMLTQPELMNRLIAACAGLGCALYDPQNGKRCEQLEPKSTG
jgi:hypothetical protein